MKVSLDTNILVQDFWLDSPHSKIFLEELKIIPATLHIPEIVIDEAINKYREFLTEKLNEYRKVNSEMNRILRQKVISNNINIDQATKDYEVFLTTKLKELKANILPYPKVEHKDVVKRILERRRPFKKGDSGYRDFLIWQTIKRLETSGTEEIVFITNNTKDFGEGGYLSEEFTDKTTGNRNFKISVSVSKFNDEYILPRLKKLDELRIQLSKGEVKSFDFKNWLDTDFTGFIEEVDLEVVLAGFPYGVGCVKASEILFYDDFKIEDIRQLNSGENLVYFDVKCKINAHTDISWDDYINNEEVREYYGDDTEEFSFLSSMISGKIEVRGYLILDSDNEKVKEYVITLLDGPGGSIEMGSRK